MTTIRLQDAPPRIGDLVAYEDMSNPRQVGEVIAVTDSEWGRDYHIRWEDGSDAHSDCRQYGWSLVAWKEHRG